LQTVTLELPDDLAQSIEAAAAAQSRTVQQFAIDQLRSAVETNVAEPPGSPAAILRIMRQAPFVSNEDVDALDAAVLESRLSASEEALFEGLDEA
jgi:hypothetical protein